MSNLTGGYLAMGPMAPMGQGLLPPLVTWLWLVALAAVLIFHCGHFVRMGGEHRWFHSSHILTLVSMLYMYASMEFKWKWFPSSSWRVIFVLSTAAIAGWMIFRLVQRRPFSFLWILALIMQAAMIYMWMPNWAPALTWTLVAYYGLETVAWLGGLLDDSKGTTAVVSGDRPVAPVAQESAVAGANMATRPASGAVGLLDDTERATAVVPDGRAAFVPLGQNSVVARASMAIMAASMGYMFAAMQLMR
jgi:hypothetical protein